MPPTFVFAVVFDPDVARARPDVPAGIVARLDHAAGVGDPDANGKVFDDLAQHQFLVSCIFERGLSLPVGMHLRGNVEHRSEVSWKRTVAALITMDARPQETKRAPFGIRPEFPRRRLQTLCHGDKLTPDQLAIVRMDGLKICVERRHAGRRVAVQQTVHLQRPPPLPRRGVELPAPQSCMLLGFFQPGIDGHERGFRPLPVGDVGEEDGDAVLRWVDPVLEPAVPRDVVVFDEDRRLCFKRLHVGIRERRSAGLGILLPIVAADEVGGFASEQFARAGVHVGVVHLRVEAHHAIADSNERRPDSLRGMAQLGYRPLSCGDTFDGGSQPVESVEYDEVLGPRPEAVRLGLAVEHERKNNERNQWPARARFGDEVQ